MWSVISGLLVGKNSTKGPQKMSSFYRVSSSNNSITFLKKKLIEYYDSIYSTKTSYYYHYSNIKMFSFLLKEVAYELHANFFQQFEGI